MNAKFKSIVIVSLLVLAGFVMVWNFGSENVKVSGASLYVGGGGPGNWSKIQDAIDNANAGDTISGWAAFKYTDYSPYNDNAVVNIYTSWGSLVAQPYYCSGSMVGNYGFRDWTEWKWLDN